MKRLLNSTIIVSVAFLPIAPLPVMAQSLDADGRILAADGTVLCEPTADFICNIEDPAIVQAAADIQARLDAEAAAQAEAEAAAAAQAEAEAAAAAQAEAEAAAAAQAEAEAAAAAQAEAEAAAAAQAEAEAAAAAQAEAEAAAAAQAEAEAAAAAQAEAEAAAAAQAEAEAAAAAQVEAEAAAAAQAEAEAAAAAQAEAEAAAAAQAEAEAAAKADAEAAAQADAAATSEAQSATAQQQAEAENLDAQGNAIDPAAGLAAEETPIDPDAPLIDAPEISQSEAEALTTLLAAPADTQGDVAAPDVAAASNEAPVIIADPNTDAPIDPAAAEEALAALPEAANTVATTVETIAPEAARTSAQEFKAAPKTTTSGKKTGLSDLEKVGLFVLGAVVVGQVLDGITGRNTVVSNTGDRVVVQRPNGGYALLKDDDAILRQPGSTVRTETFDDGSSRTIVQRADGTQVVTVRDATGRVLRRAQYDRLGRELVLLDDFAPEVPVDTASLPRPRITQSTSNATDAAIRAAIAARQISKLNRAFSLRQIREIPEVRTLAAEVDVESVTFRSGSAAITPQQANSLADLGDVMADMLAENPAEMFLVEGHTDATGAGAMNLALSDRRAESVALALTEYFGIPPENMIVQGYGETELRVNTQADEPRNRRVVVRIITPLLKVGG